MTWLGHSTILLEIDGHRFLTDPVWWFYLFWLPKYLYDARGFDIKAVGAFAWIPYAFSGVGSLCGGWFSSELIRRGYSDAQIGAAVRDVHRDGAAVLERLLRASSASR